MAHATSSTSAAEMRIHFGRGYRAYFTRHARVGTHFVPTRCSAFTFAGVGKAQRAHAPHTTNLPSPPFNL